MELDGHGVSRGGSEDLGPHLRRRSSSQGRNERMRPFFGMWFSYRCVTSLSSPSYQASQKLWDWRSSLRHTAEVVANRYLDANSLTREVGNRASFCEKLIDGGRFLYENPLSENTTVHRFASIDFFAAELAFQRLFHSPFMATVLAVHLDVTKNAYLDVPNLYPKGTAPHLPIGAIGLAAAAVRSHTTCFHNYLAFIMATSSSASSRSTAAIACRSTRRRVYGSPSRSTTPVPATIAQTTPILPRNASAAQRPNIPSVLVRWPLPGSTLSSKPRRSTGAPLPATLLSLAKSRSAGGMSWRMTMVMSSTFAGT